MFKAAGTAVIAVLAAALAAAPASATIETTRSAPALGSAIDASGDITGGTVVSIPPTGTAEPLGISSTPMTKFPRQGTDFAVLTTGSALAAQLPNDSDRTGSDLGGPHVRGDTDVDVSIVRLDVAVPSGDSCLSFDFRFLSEEFPEFVFAGDNDGFVAELDSSNWATANQTINAPNDFAVTSSDRPISVDQLGSSNVAPERATTTTYDAATRLLRASTPVTPGTHQLFLSIFDQGDHQYDSAAFVDNLVVDNRVPCTKGAAPVDDIDPDTKLKRKPPKHSTQRRGKFKFSSTKLDSTYECKVDRKDFKPCESPEKTRRLKRGRHKFRVRAIDPDGNVDPMPAVYKWTVE